MILEEGVKIFKLANKFRKLKTSENNLGKKRAAQYLCQLMGSEKGIFLKIGQALGSSANSMDEFKKLTDGKLEALTMEVIKNIIEETYHLPMEEIFSSFNPSGRMASIGQVHEAMLLDGTPVAVKIQYPHIKKAIQNQLNFLNLIPLKMGPVRKWGIPVNDYLELLWRNMDEELSYLHEIRNQKRYKKMVQEHFTVSVADVLDKYSCDHIFFQSWQEGTKIEDVCKNWSMENKQKAGHILLESFFIHFFHHGFLQSDPNDGNYLFRMDGNGRPHVVYLDFGSCTEYSDDFRLAALRLILAANNKEEIDPLPYLALLGFDETKLKHIHKSLPALVKILFEPLLSDRPYDLKNWGAQKQIDIILGEFKWWFRSAGSPHFFMLMKSFAGLVSQLTRLEANLEWKKILFKTVSPLVAKASSFQAPPVSLEKYTFKSLATKLRINVHRDGKEKADITLPIHALVDLEGFIDEDVLQKIRARKIDLSKIILNNTRSGCYPAELFNLDEGYSKFKVWTE